MSPRTEDYVETAIEHAPSDWRPIDTAPKDTPVLLYCPALDFRRPYDFNEMTVGKQINGLWVSDNEDINPLHPTHWQPLPEPPDE